jgi:signal transduction histidine kinase
VRGRRLSPRLRALLACVGSFVLGGLFLQVLVRGAQNLAQSSEGYYRPWCNAGFADYRCSEGWGQTFAYTVTDVAILVAVLVAIWLATSWTLRPFTTVTDTIAQLGPQNLGQRIRWPGGRREERVKRLADTVDGMLDRLASGFDGQRRFASNASHELRTPLAVQRMLIELAMETGSADTDLHRLGTQLLVSNERSELMIEGLLVLAESDRGLSGRVPIRLDELVGAVLDRHAELAARHQVRLDREVTELVVDGDPVLLDRLVTNLVQNAIKYNHPAGWVLVEVGGEADLVVRNSGQPVPAEAVPTLFEPFRRLARDRTGGQRGSGLGLSIVRSIVDAHGGRVDGTPNPGGGLVITVTLSRNEVG